MIAAFVSLLAVTLLTDAELASAIERRKEEAYSADDAGVERESADQLEFASISSKTCDADRGKRVFLFEGDVRVDYNGDTTLNAERLFVFLNSSNRFSRLVAVGAVSITNNTRFGSCDMATFSKKAGRIDMYGGKDGTPACLREGTDQVEGSHVRFWMESEFVEVYDSEISVKTKGEGLMQ